MSCRRAAVPLAIVTALLGASACSGDPPDPDPSGSPSDPPISAPERLTFGVFGPEAEVAAYSTLATDYAAAQPDVDVEVVSYPTADAASRGYRAGELPDVFLLSQRDLAEFTQGELLRPVDELLDARGVSFGDTYARDALDAFAVDNSLTCIPASVSPMVIFYNTDLIDFTTMLERGLDAPESEDGELPTSWDFEQFTAAAEFATRPRRGTRGVSIDPSLSGLSPFLYAGGGQLFDDNRQPTSLAFSDDGTREALRTTLTLLRDAQITPTASQLAAADATTLFEDGQLGMIAGYRSLVPRLREAPGLSFDVMPMPSISRSATVGDVIGLCLSAETEGLSAAADFMLSVLSDESVAEVARAGYTVPANVRVASSEDFLQPGEQPANAEVFRISVRRIEIPPLLDSWEDLEAVVDEPLRQLVTGQGVLGDEILELLTAEIDERSREVLSPPEPTDSASPGDGSS